MENKTKKLKEGDILPLNGYLYRVTRVNVGRGEETCEDCDVDGGLYCDLIPCHCGDCKVKGKRYVLKNIGLDLSQTTTEELKKELLKRGESVGLSKEERNAYLKQMKGYIKEMNDIDGEMCDSTVHSLSDEMMVDILKKIGGFDEFIELYNDIPRCFE